eukprot:4224666-Prymnesium_polylepis.1
MCRRLIFSPKRWQDPCASADATGELAGGCPCRSAEKFLCGAGSHISDRQHCQIVDEWRAIRL